MTLSTAEKLLLELGVTDPAEINLLVIARYLGAIVRFSELDSCEARIIGVGDHAIIRISSKSNPRRQRFSIAHEIGHWVHHRGLQLMCDEADFRPSERRSASREATANSFAGKLLLPGYLLDIAVKNQSLRDFSSVRSIADQFDTSYTSTALRLIERRYAPMMLISYGPGGRRWFKRSIDLKEELYPPAEPPPSSSAFRIVNGSGRVPATAKMVDATTWFTHWEAHGLRAIEDCLNLGNRQVLTLLTFPDRSALRS